MDIVKILLVAAGLMWPITIILVSRILRQNDRRLENLEKFKEDTQEICRQFAIVKDRCDHKYTEKNRG